jgi:cell wall-associated NlpC family hydrolase
MSNGGCAESGISRRAPIAVLLALVMAVAGATGARAAPAPDAALVARAKALQAKLDAQHAEIERITERLNGIDEQRRKVQASLAAARARQRAAQAELAAAQQRLDEQARATYMQGPQWLLSELVGDGSSPDPMQRLPRQKAALEAHAAVVDEVRQRKAEVDTLGRRVALDLAEVERVHRGYADQRRRVEVLVTQLKTTLAGIDRKLAGYLEAERARAEAARRAAYAGYMSGVGSVQSWLLAGPVARAAVRWALAQLGDPYRWGAVGPDAFDCSGLTSSAYRAAGTAIPRVSRDQWNAGPHVDVANLLPGDLVFFADNTRDPSTIHHVGMYVGNGLMVNAPYTGAVVRLASIWREGYIGATRIVPGVPRPGAPLPPTAPPPTSPTPPTPPTMTTAPPSTAPPTTRAPTTTAPGSSTTTTTGTTTTGTTTTTAPTTTEAPTTTQATTTTAAAAAEAPTTTAAPTTTGATTTAPPTTT